MTFEDDQNKDDILVGIASLFPFISTSNSNLGKLISLVPYSLFPYSLFYELDSLMRPLLQHSFETIHHICSIFSHDLLLMGIAKIDLCHK